MKRIYLDTYDYSTIIKHSNPNTFYDRIENLKSNGCLFYFSSISITETKPDTTSNNKDLIYKHAKAIEKICDSNSLIHFLELFELEKNSFKTKEKLDPNIIFSSENWINSKFKDDLLNEYRNELNLLTNIGTNRESRRNKKHHQLTIKNALIKSLSTNPEIRNLIGFEWYKKSILNCEELDAETLIELFKKFINSPVNSVKIFSNNKIDGIEFSSWLSDAASSYKDELIEKKNFLKSI